MKGPIPTPEHLSRLYYELARHGALAVGSKKKWPYHPPDVESLLALAADWSRWDPRLLQILVVYGGRHWPRLYPQRLRALAKTMQTPQALGVIGSFIQESLPEDPEAVRFWRYVTEGLRPVAPQYYFFNLHPPAGPLAQRIARESLTAFKDWGFLGRERVVVDPRTRRQVGHWDTDSRLNILKRLLAQGPLQLSDYLREIDHSLSRQQALLDLKRAGALQQGHGRGALWRPPV